MVVNTLDRSSRKAKDFLNFLDLLQSRKAEFVSVTQPYLDTTTPYGRAMVASMMVFAQLEAEIDGRRLVEDIEYRQSEGQMWGPVPLGYSAANKAEGSAYKLRAPDDAPLVVRLLQAYAAGDVSLKALARLANTWEAPHLEGGSWRMRRRDGTRVPFTFRSVESIRDTVWIYVGRVVRYGGKDGEESYEGKHRPIIAAELADRVQATRERREDPRLTSARASGVSTYPLTPLLRCAISGKPYRGAKARGRRVY